MAHEIQAMETGNPSSILVRDWDSPNFYEISMIEYYRREENAGAVSAFAETRAVFYGEAVGTGMTVDAFKKYRNQ